MQVGGKDVRIFDDGFATAQIPLRDRNGASCNIARIVVETPDELQDVLRDIWSEALLWVSGLLLTFLRQSW